MALASTDPRVLMGQAKCFTCLTPHQQYILRTYLLALIAMGDTSIAGVQALSAASTCFSCLTYEELLAAKQYLMAVWLGLDTSKAGIIAQAKTAACDYACLTPKQAEQLRTYLLAVTAGVSTTAAGVRALAAAANCFNCLESKQQLEAQVYLLSILAPGAPTTPATIIAGAKCFLACVPPELREALQTSLFAQVTNRSTPPCVTPTAPTQPAVFSALNNILKISWTQPANSGSLIQSYTVSYGTTQGGPYTGTKTVQAGTKQATLSGLTSGTTYFFVVTANSFTGCGSANSPEGSATTTGTPPVCNAGLTFANAWATRVVANGGAAPSQSTINAIGNFQCGLITDGLDTLMISWSAFVPDNLIAAITPQLVSATGGSGGTPSFDPWTNHNFVAGDLTVNGLIGDGATKYLDTGLQAQSCFSAVDNVGCTGYPQAANTGFFCGCDNGTNTQDLSLNNNFFAAWTFASHISGTIPGFAGGYVSGNVVPGGAGNIYEANSTNAHASTAAGAMGLGSLTVPPFKITVFATNNNTGPTTFDGARLSFFAVHKGLTSAQSAKFFARIQTLRQALGGGFV